MRLRIISLAIILLSAALAAGQSTAVTLQVTDSDGIQWANGTWQVQLIAGTSGSSGPYNIIPNGPVVPNQLQSGGLTSTGAATMTLTPNASIAPAGTIWYFAVCPNATTDCYRQSVVIVGASQTVTLVPPGIRINGANAPPNARAYNDLEIVSPTIGTQYFNVSTTAQRIWLGTIWTNLGGGASSPALTLTNSSNCTTANSFVELDTAHLDATGNATAQTASLNSKKVIGVASSGAGCSGTVSIATSLSTQVIADGQTQVGDWVAASPTAVGEANDYGAAKSTSVQTVGIVSKANTGAGTLTTIIIGTGDQLSNGSSNSNGSVANSGCANAVPYYATTGNAVSPDCSFTTNGSGTVGLTNLNVNGAGTGVVTFSSGAAPSNPASGKFALYGDSGSGSLKCLNSSGGSCLNTTPSWSQITAGSNLFAQTMGTGGSMTPVNSGQIASTQAWPTPGISAPTTTGTNTGGTIMSSQSWLIQITLNTALGETLPSVEISANSQTISGGVCVSGGCTLTVVAPSLTGYTSYNVYACNTSSGPCTTAQKVAACTAITTNCVFTTPYGTNTSGVPTVATAYPQPTNTQAFNGMNGETPFLFFPKPDGKYYPWASVDWSTGNNFPAGTPVFTHRTFFSDFGNGLNTSPAYGQLWAQQAGNNSFISINHLYGLNTSQSNQDRSLWITGATPVHDTSTHYGLAGLQLELDVNGDSGFNVNGSPDGEITSASLQLQNNLTAAFCCPALGANIIRGSYFQGQSGANAFDIGNVTGVAIAFAQNATTNNLPSSRKWTGFQFSTALANGVNQTNLQQYGFATSWGGSGSARFGTINISLYNQVQGGWTPVQNNDFFLRNDSSTMDSDINGIVYVRGIRSDLGTALLPTLAPLQVTGGIQSAQSPTITGFTEGCAGGVSGTTWTYVVVGHDANGGLVSSGNLNVSCAATLDGTHFNQLSLNFSSRFSVTPGFVSYDLYRTVAGGTPNTTGLIVQGITCSGSVNTGGCPLTNDTGLAIINSNSPPATNTTGTIFAGGDMGFNISKGQHFDTQATNNDLGGVATCAASTVTVTFSRTYTSTPVIVVSDETAAGGARVSAKSASSFTITCTGATDVVDYIVVGNPN